MNLVKQGDLDTLEQYTPRIDWTKLMAMTPRINTDLLDSTKEVARDAFARAMVLLDRPAEPLNFITGNPEMDSGLKALSDEPLPNLEQMQNSPEVYSKVMSIGNVILNLLGIENHTDEEEILALNELFSRPDFFKEMVKGIHITAAENEYIVLPEAEAVIEEFDTAA